MRLTLDDAQKIIDQLNYYDAVSNGANQIELKEKYELARLGTLRIWNLKRKILEMQAKKI